jgi:kynurenine 3-monooxygenase
MEKKLNERVAIFGGGLVGSLLAIYLAKKGCTVDVYERRSDMRIVGAEVGRSINLALSDRGWRALEGVGIADEVRSIGIPMKGRMMHGQSGELAFQPYGEEGQAIYSVSRGVLNNKLLDLAESFPRVNFHFNCRCEHVDFAATKAVVENLKTGEQFEVKADIIFGADGAFSAVRSAMQKTDRFNFEQFYIEHGYKELSIPPAADGGWRLEKNALHIWPRKQFMMIALPNLDGSFTCTLFFPFEGNPSFKSLKTKEDVAAFFKEVFPDAVPHMPTLEEDFFSNPTSSLVTIKCFPWIKEKVALIGDASHGIVPFYGQGMNAGFEDCTVLNEVIESSDGDWSQILSRYQISRKSNADAIADLALQNFVEMRDLVADPKFLLRKKIEARLHAAYPGKWIPLYTMVTFSDIPYAEALKEGQLHDKVMRKIMELEGIEQNWETEPRIYEIVKQSGLLD